MKLAIISSLVMLLSLPYIKTTVVYAQSGQVTLKPTDDTYVDSSNPNSNYGGQTYLEIEYSVLGSEPYQTIYKDLAWLKFGLSTIPNGAVIDEATLQLYAMIVGETFNVHAYSCSYDSWTELTLTYSNMPSYNATSIDTTIVATSNRWYNWSVVDAVRNALTGNFIAITTVLSESSPHSSLSDIWFYSKNAPVIITDYSPILTIHWSSIVPEFPTFLLLPLFMIATLFGVIVYRKKNLAKVSAHAKRSMA